MRTNLKTICCKSTQLYCQTLSTCDLLNLPLLIAVLITLRFALNSFNWLFVIIFHSIFHNNNNHISVIELGHLLTRSSLTHQEVSSKVCHNSFYQLQNSVSLPWVIYYEAFYLHVVSSFSCIPVICPKLVLFLIPL